MKSLFGGAIVCTIALLSGCVETTQSTRPAPVPIITTGNVLACPAGTDCRAGGQAAVRVTVDEYGYVRGQAVREEWSAWGDKRPPIKFEPTRRNETRLRHPRYDGMNDDQRREFEFGRRNKCYTYRKQNGEPACL